MNILGVDPGASGALAVIRDGDVTGLHDMPVGDVTVGRSVRKRIIPELLAEILRAEFPLDVAYIEEVAAMPKQGVSSVFTFGQAHGLVLGAVVAIGIRAIRIRPQEWQRTVRATKDPRVRALELYPRLAPVLRRKKDEGRADAVLLAHYGLTKEMTT